MANNLCASNLTSGFIDLATYDEQEKYLYGGPDSVAYFVREIRKATWFTQVPVCLSRSSGQPGFGQQWSVQISRAGDYLLQSWLRLTLNAVTGQPLGNTTVAGSTTTILRWTKNFMHNLITECNISFNDLVAARFDNYHLDFWAAFTVPAGKRNGYNSMIGTFDTLINPIISNGFPGAGATQVLPQVTLNLPLPFFYTRDTGLALPTAALPYNEMKINFAFQTWQNLLIADVWNAGANAGGVNGYWTSVPAQIANMTVEPSMSNVQVWANYAIVSNDERKKMACAPRDILIEQVQTAPVQSFAPVTNPSPVYDIRFSHAIKALFWSARNVGTVGTYATGGSGNMWSNYTTSALMPQGNGTATNLWSPYYNVYPNTNTPMIQPTPSNPPPAGFGVINLNAGTDPVLNTTLVYENTQRLYQMGSDYFSLVNPWYTSPVIPLDTGFHLYSYSLDFFCIDPMGSTNYGKLTNVSIAPVASNDAIAVAANVNIVPGASSSVAYGAKFNFIVTALNNNIIRISGGALGQHGRPKRGRCSKGCGNTFWGKHSNFRQTILVCI
jgi:hypothetical protein